LKPTDFAYSLTEYLSKYLPGQIGVSANTVRSYRDTFSLLLRFFTQEYGVSPDKLSFSQITKGRVEQFLTHLGMERGCSVSTRNQRLAAIHAFFRYMQTERPEHIHSCQEILAIPFKKQPKSNIIRHINLDMMKEILAAPDSNTRKGRRELVMLSVLYDSGARIQEIADLCVEDVRTEAPPSIRLHGKPNNKWRIVPLMTQTASLLDGYLNEWGLTSPEKKKAPLFTNRHGQRLTTAGIRYIFNKYVDPDAVTPHMFRHSKAMHLLQSGVNIVYIRDVLGHANISTTEIYARADVEMKRKALEKAYPSPAPDNLPSWQKDETLLAWLKNLGRE
jgi:site-specific recombinase XerD